MRRSEKQNSIKPITDYSAILDSIDDMGNTEYTISLLSAIEGKVSDDEKSSLADSVACCCCIGNDDLAKEIAKKIDPTTFETDEEHYAFLWSVANYRAVETFEYLIDAGFKGSALAANEQAGDVFYQILSQATDKTIPDMHSTDIRMIRKLLQTRTIYGYTDATLRDKALLDLQDLDFPLRSLNRTLVAKTETPDSPLTISAKRDNEEGSGKALSAKEGNQEGKIGGSNGCCSIM